MRISKNETQTCSRYQADEHIWRQVDGADVAEGAGRCVLEEDAHCQPSPSPSPVGRSSFLKRGPRILGSQN